MIALLLAQLVMPSPSVEPLEPPGMICMGECSDGPMVWRASPARGRLVVACDMRSDTCSDGRKITTERATPVPCEVAPGQWEMVPEDTACISYRGLEAWAATTSYVSHGAELDRSPWLVMSTNTLTPLPGGGYRLCQQEGASANSGIRQYTGLEAGLTFTASAMVRANTATHALLGVGNAYAHNLPLPAEWGRISYTGITSGTTHLNLYPRPPGAGQCVDLIGFWATTTDTPGRACWGGEAPVHCAEDRHTISTEGWPTEEGEVCVTVTLGEDAPSPAVILDGRAASGDVGSVVYWQTTGLYWKSDTSQMRVPEVERGVANHICAGRKGGKLTVRVNGVLHEGPSAPPLAWQPTAILGHGRVASQVINGSISSLHVRSLE